MPLSRVTGLLQNLEQSKATGIDGIYARLLKETADIIGISLTNLINTGSYPEEWKSSKVFPVFKTGKRSDKNNYRPISVIPVISKVCERIIFDQLYNYLQDNDILSNCQSGFRQIHSTLSSLLEATNDWRSLNIDQGLINAVVFIDLAKAFDTVNHDI